MRFAAPQDTHAAITGEGRPACMSSPSWCAGQGTDTPMHVCDSPACGVTVARPFRLHTGFRGMSGPSMAPRTCVDPQEVAWLRRHASSEQPRSAYSMQGAVPCTHGQRPSIQGRTG